VPVINSKNASFQIIEDLRRKDREKMLKKQEKPYAKITQMNARPLRRV
jgi:hypothetical protein